MFSSLISAAAFILGASQAFAAPAPQATEQPDSGGNCLTTFGPFALTAKRISTGDTYTVRLLTDQVTAITTTSHMIVDTKANCKNCGIVPTYWVLNNGQLSVYGTPGLPGLTVNQPVHHGDQLSFISSTQTQPDYPIYCSQKGDSAFTRTLSVHNNSTLFTMCAFTSANPAPTIYPIIYDQTPILPAGESCFPVNLFTVPNAFT